MKITLKDQKPYPVWLTRVGKGTEPSKYTGGGAYYRTLIPARMTGGRIIHELQIINNHKVETLNIFDQEQRSRFASLLHATVLGLGSSTIFRLTEVQVNRPEWLVILRALREAGCRLYIEADDDVFGLVFTPDKLGGCLEHNHAALAEKIKASIHHAMPFGVPFMSKADVDAYIDANIHKMIE